MNFTLVTSFDCKQAAVRCVRYNSDGDFCVTAGSDKTIRLWNPCKRLLLKRYDGHHSDVLDAVSSHDNANIVSGGTDKTVLLWDVSASEPVRRIRGHFGDVNCVLFNADSSVVLSGSADHSVRVWDTRSRSKEAVQVSRPLRSWSVQASCWQTESKSGCIACHLAATTVSFF